MIEEKQLPEIKHVLLTESVTYNGAILEPGNVVKLYEPSAVALIKEGKGEEVASDGTKALLSDENPNAHLTPSSGSENDTEERLALVKKALNDKYTRDKLAEEAKAVDVEFAYDAKKAEIVEAVITAGKAEVLLAKE